MADAPSEWGTADASLTDPTPSNLAPSLWGTADASLTDPGAGPTPPSVPTNVVITRTGNTINSQWDAPADDGGSPVIGWKLNRGDGMAGATDDLPLVGSGPFLDSYEETTPALIGNPDYAVRLAAVNAAGTGPYSDAVYPYRAPVVYAPSAWGAADASLSDPAPSGGFAPSAWGTTDATLIDPIPEGGWAPSAWGTADATLGGTEPSGYPAYRWNGTTYVPLNVHVWAGSSYITIN